MVRLGAPYEISLGLSYIIYCLTVIALSATANFILISDDLLYDYFGDQLSTQRIMTFIDESRKWNWLAYVVIPIVYFFKFSAISLCLYLGALLINAKIKLSEFYRIVIASEYLFLAPAIIKLYWFSFIDIHYTIGDLQSFFPLSVYSTFEITDLEMWVLYPLQVLNIFELFYWCVLSFQLKNLIERDFVGSLGFVASTYGVGLLLWVIFVMFLTVSLT